MQVKYLTTVLVVLMFMTCLTACAEETQKETRKETQISVQKVSQMDKDCWKSFAEKENVYFSNAVLLFSGTDGKLVMGNEEETIRYKENFAWMVSSSEKGNSADKNLDLFIQETKRDYPQNSDK